ncbi:MAG: hypothetical protein F6K10_01530 [Moorea sp. SIO2B7]|nr:hypothetical protein [Moorena sp. SIO2B7]
MARGSARSVNKIDLYKLVESQAHLLHRFGGHPLAAGLSLPVENIPLFREAINQQLRQQIGDTDLMMPIMEADLIITVAELGKTLFRELKLLEPCGMGNPVPKLLIKNCWFEQVWHNNAQDLRGKKVQYIKTKFEICDDSTNQGFPGIWWGHYKEELPQNQQCDAIVELDFNAYKKRYEVRLMDVQPSISTSQFSSSIAQNNYILDLRGDQHSEMQEKVIRLEECPLSWNEIRISYRRAIASERKLVLAYSYPKQLSSEKIWEQLVGIAKYLSRTAKSATKEQFKQKLGLSDYSLNLGFKTLSELGFEFKYPNDCLEISWYSSISSTVEESIFSFISAVEEEQFRREYFYQVSLSTIENMVSQTTGV